MDKASRCRHQREKTLHAIKVSRRQTFGQDWLQRAQGKGPEPGCTATGSIPAWRAIQAHQGGLLPAAHHKKTPKDVMRCSLAPTSSSHHLEGRAPLLQLIYVREAHLLL